MAEFKTDIEFKKYFPTIHMRSQVTCCYRTASVVAHKPYLQAWESGLCPIYQFMVVGQILGLALERNRGDAIGTAAFATQGAIRIYDVNEEIGSKFRFDLPDSADHHSRRRLMSFLDSKLYVSGKNGTVNLYNTASRRLVRQFDPGQYQSVSSLNCDPDHAELLVVGHHSSGGVSLFATQTGQLIRSLPLDGTVYSAQVRPGLVNVKEVMCSGVFISDLFVLMWSACVVCRCLWEQPLLCLRALHLPVILWFSICVVNEKCIVLVMYVRVRLCLEVALCSFPHTEILSVCLHCCCYCFEGLIV